MSIDGDDDLEDGSVLLDDSIQAFYGHSNEPVYTCTLSPSQPTVACTGGGDDAAYLWNVENGEKLVELPRHKDSVIAAGFSHDGRYIATGGMDGVVNVSVVPDDLTELRPVTSQTLEGPGEVTSMRWHPKGHALAVGTAEGQVWLFFISSPTSFNIMSVASISSEAVTQCRFTADGKNLIASAHDGSISCWDPKDMGKPVWKADLSLDGRWHEGSVLSFDLIHSTENQQQQILVSGGEDGKCMVLQIATGRLLATLAAHDDSIEAVSLCDILPFCSTASMDGTIKIWDINSMQLRTTLRHEDGVTIAFFLPNSSLLLSGSVDRTVRLWDARSGDCLKKWHGHQETVLSLDVNQRYVITASDDGVALVFQLQ